MREYHKIWLAAHPGRTEEWLKERIRDGFHVHHIDGDHENNDPANLVLIDGVDHGMIHGRKIDLRNEIKEGKERSKLIREFTKAVKHLSERAWVYNRYMQRKAHREWREGRMESIQLAKQAIDREGSAEEIFQLYGRPFFSSYQAFMRSVALTKTRMTH